eukprot:CAMPEP_0116565798 /NCGR_PEP_ID=MMETSP0397-20121206/14093_1 /TAXON_ID=216820 /ORGANISM="Cyclophora tenuis, Strain ECT3854" /LENGTH=214 /DNA_ID=CAMNT_0004092601 /DNA_START=627 /DNA_END=1268 /DNA_ORIENTATION=+
MLGILSLTLIVMACCGCNVARFTRALMMQEDNHHQNPWAINASSSSSRHAFPGEIGTEEAEDIETVLVPPVPMTPKLRSVKYQDLTDEDPRECCICMLEFVQESDDNDDDDEEGGGGEEEAIVRTECNHVFHRECCTHWFERSNNCPVCRAPVTMIPLTATTTTTTTTATTTATTTNSSSGGGIGTTSIGTNTVAVAATRAAVAAATAAAMTTT